MELESVRDAEMQRERESERASETANGSFDSFIVPQDLPGARPAPPWPYDTPRRESPYQLEMHYAHMPLAENRAFPRSSSASFLPPNAQLSV